MSGRSSRNKGKRGEREFASYLRDHGYSARRGVQHRGGAGSPDVIAEPAWIHWEVKRVERLQLHAAMTQACEDAGAAQVPVVAYRRSRSPWLAVLRMDDLMRLVAAEDYVRTIEGMGQ